MATRGVVRWSGWTLTFVVTGCAELLGGLDEATLPTRDAADAAADRAPSAPVRTDWLAGFRYRVAYEIDSSEPSPLPGYSLRVALDTRSAVDARKMRPDGADIRVTTSDGLSVVPHWIGSAVGGDATTLWAKVDLAPGPNVVFVYYGSDVADQAASLRDTFIDGIVDNPTFDGTAPWIVTPPTNGGTASLEMHQQQATITFSRPSGDAPSSTGWCQTVTFPPGRRYRIVFDVVAVQADRADMSLWTGKVGGTSIWTDAAGSGARRGMDSDVIEAGTTQLCLGGTVHALAVPERLSAYYQNVRVRSYAATDPLAGPAGPEEAR